MKSHNRLSTSSVALIIAAGLYLCATSDRVEAAGRPDWLNQAEYFGSGSVTVVVFLDTETLAGEIRSIAAPMVTRESRIKAVTARLKSHRTVAGNAV